LVFQLEENDIIRFVENIGDFECSAEARKLSVISKENDARLLLKYDRSDPDKTIPNSSKLLKKSLLNNATGLASAIDKDLKSRAKVLIDSDGLVPTIEMEIKIQGPRFKIDTSDKGMILDLTKLGYDRAGMTGKFFGEHALNMNFGNEQTGYNEILHLGSE
jgi:hypothetical protein